ncbi:MAG TPA: oligosaccharide flippase family protein [Candidatus Limnocylindrales bacterium]|nr:oligosaccharide flippase family protein [Candidatus Limnocylindrales bacterium]
MSQSESAVVLPAANTPAPAGIRRSAHSLVLGGSIIMLVSSTAVSGINFGSNVVMARLLGPAGFGQVAVATTMLMLASSVTLSFQLVCAKFVARNQDVPAKSAVFHSLLRKSWVFSLALGALLVVARHPLASYLNLPDKRILLLLAIGIAFYAPVGVRRGGMQGLCSFGRLSGSFLVEAGMRFTVGLVLVLAGYGVMGGVGAISAGVLAAYLVPWLPSEFRVRPQTGEPASFAEAFQAIVFFIGQVVINNIDIVLVKHFFAPEQAGIYAAIALVGRVLYFAAWNVVSAMFPVSAAAANEHENPKVVLVPMLLVVGISAAFILTVSLFPGFIMGTIFGRLFAHNNGLLSLYAVATALYSLSVVLMAYEMSRRIANTGWLQLLFSGVLVFAIGAFHSTLRQVIVVQIVLMLAMLALVAFPFLRRFRPAPLEAA